MVSECIVFFDQPSDVIFIFSAALRVGLDVKVQELVLQLCEGFLINQDGNG
jgi:hypothetical protein